MEHHESSVKVYFTRNYKRFRFEVGNRDLSNKNIKNKVKEIALGNNRLKEYPIIVEENGEFLDIKDGQHRFLLSKKLDEPIYYIIASKEFSIRDVAAVNTATEKWKPIDYIKCYERRGNKNYSILLQFIEKYGLNADMSLSLLHYGTVSGPYDRLGAFKKGKFEVKRLRESEDFMRYVEKFKADKIAKRAPKEDRSEKSDIEKFQHGEFEVKTHQQAVETAELLKKFYKTKLSGSRSFITAICKIKAVGKIDMQELLRRFNLSTIELVSGTRSDDIIKQLTTIYNEGQSIKIDLI